MPARSDITDKVQAIAERVGGSEGIEIVDVQMLGGGAHRVLRLIIDRSTGPSGVTHSDCEFISHQVGTILDVEDVIPGGHYTLEVSSPGVERKLTKPREFERFVGQKVKVVLRQPVENQRLWIGALKSFAEGILTIEPAPGKSIQIPFDQVEKANLKFEW